MKQELRHIAHAAMAVAALFCTACSSDAPKPQGDAPKPLVIVADGLPWQEQQVSVTRAGETLDGLRDTGFGLYCSSPAFANQQVTFNASAWDYGGPLLWPQNEVDTDAKFYAYAPYYNGTSSPYASMVTAYTEGTIAFTCPSSLDAMPDLLYAAGTVDTEGAVSFTFHHALGRLSFGTVTNKYGQDITLKSISLSGDVYKSGKLNLATGSWSNLRKYSDDGETAPQMTITYNGGTGSGEMPEVVVPNGNTLRVQTGYLMFIPGDDTTPAPDITVSITFSTPDYGEETLELKPQIVQGQDKMYNITIDENHRVVID